MWKPNRSPICIEQEGCKVAVAILVVGSLTKHQVGASGNRGKAPEDKALTSSQEQNCRGERERYGSFSDWLHNRNHGKRTTLKQQMELAIQLYDEAMGPETDPPSVDEIIENLQSTLIQDTDSLVTWSGIRVDWFLNVFCESPFLKRLREFGCELWFVRKVVIIEMIRRNAVGNNNTLSGPFVHHVDSVRHGMGLIGAEEGGKGVVAKATTFISYTGACTLDHVVDAMSQLNGDEYIWFDLFCVDQFAWNGKGRTPEMERFRNVFMDDLQAQIKAINGTALILEKWNNIMTTLEQMWVLWEIFNTAQAGAKMRVLLPQSEVGNFVENCLERETEFDSILESLASIDANNAKAEDDSDRRFIFQRMQEFGLEGVNSLVARVVRGWLIEVAEDHLEFQTQVTGGPSAAFYNQIGMLYFEQDRLAEAENFIRKSFDHRLNSGNPGTQHAVLGTINNLAMILHAKGELVEAEKLQRMALERRRELLGNTHHETIESVNNLAGLLEALGKNDEAEQLYREAVFLAKASGFQKTSTHAPMYNLAMFLQQQGRYDEAESLYKESLDRLRDLLLGDRHPTVLRVMNGYAVFLHTQRRLLEAEPLYRQTLLGRRQQLGDQHPQTLHTIHVLATLLKDRGQRWEAKLLFREALNGKRATLGAKHHDTIRAIHDFAVLLYEDRDLRVAEPMFREAADGWSLLGKSSSLSTSLLYLAQTMLDQGRPSEAEPVCREALRWRLSIESEKHNVESLHAMYILACILHKNGRASAPRMRSEKFAEAERLYRVVVDGWRKRVGAQHHMAASANQNLIVLLKDQGKLSEAASVYRDDLRLKQQELGQHHLETLSVLHLLGVLLVQQGNLPEAERMLQEAVSHRRQQLGLANIDTLSSVEKLAEVMDRGKRYREAEALYRDALEGRLLTSGELHEDTLYVVHNLGNTIFNGDCNRREEAAMYMERALRGSRVALGDDHPVTVSAANAVNIMRG